MIKPDAYDNYAKKMHINIENTSVTAKLCFKITLVSAPLTQNRSHFTKSNHNVIQFDVSVNRSANL